MKKFHIRMLIGYVLLPVLLVSMPIAWQASAAGQTKCFDWYFKPTDDHTQPQVIPEATFLEGRDDVLYLGRADQKTVYLTFDAGFDNGHHEEILDTLKQKKVKAAFFVDGNFVKSNPDLVRRIVNEGHVLGNHSLKHPDMTAITDFDAYREQIEGWEKLVSDIGVTPTKFFRFPSGKFSECALEYNRKLGIKSVFWSFAYFDWDADRQPDEQAALAKIMSRMHNGAVVLLHSTSATNAAILSDYIDQMQSEGYTFSSLTEFKA